MDATAHVADLAGFLVAAPTSFHAAREVERRLTARGWSPLEETADWTESVRPGGRHVVVRDGAVVAFALPETAAADTAVRLIGAHTDSPGFVLKPGPAWQNHGWMQIGVEVYGGPILASWFDRDLAIAGRFIDDEGGSHLLRTGAIARVPHLAIHLDRDVNERFSPDRQRDVQPLVGLDGAGLESLAAHLAEASGVDPERIAGADLRLVDAQRPGRVGIRGELLAAGRLDNLVSVHAATLALLEAAPTDTISMLAAFDHEEVGSGSRTGASGPLLEEVLVRLRAALGGTAADAARAGAASWCVSADAGHAVHPNRSERHDPQVRPVAGGGPLLKINASQRYASDARGAALWQRACSAAGTTPQPFVSHNGVPCGSTIGPLTAARIGFRTVDVGVPLLSMHSARELVAVDDAAALTGALTAYLGGA